MQAVITTSFRFFTNWLFNNFNSWFFNSFFNSWFFNSFLIDHTFGTSPATASPLTSAFFGRFLLGLLLSLLRKRSSSCSARSGSEASFCMVRNAVCAFEAGGQVTCMSDMFLDLYANAHRLIPEYHSKEFQILISAMWLLEPGRSCASYLEDPRSCTKNQDLWELQPATWYWKPINPNVNGYTAFVWTYHPSIDLRKTYNFYVWEIYIAHNILLIIFCAHPKAFQPWCLNHFSHVLFSGCPFRLIEAIHRGVSLFFKGLRNRDIIFQGLSVLDEQRTVNSRGEQSIYITKPFAQRDYKSILVFTS